MRRSSPWLFVMVVQALACKKPETEAPAASLSAAEVPIRAEAVSVETRPMPDFLVVTGTLRANQESEVAADAAGKVSSTFVERGQRVKQGDTLAILDARGASITASAASAQSELAKAQLEQARRECDRVKSLKDSGAISQAEFDRVTSLCQTTQWSAAAAQAQRENAQKIVGDTVIRAPFSGVVGERYVNVGQFVQPATRVVSLYAADPLRLELTVPEANVAGIRPEQVVVFTVAAFGTESFRGAVRFVSPNVRPTTRDLVIEAVCPNPDLKLKPGMFAVARLETTERPQLVVPTRAVVRQGEVARVYAISSGRIEEHIVQLGAEREGFTAIAVGVKAGDRVVVSPSSDVRDGARVQ
jgi:membrane fusion protein (multidrug efflux system)